jgi:hypothetical protein
MTVAGSFIPWVISSLQLNLAAGVFSPGTYPSVLMLPYSGF